MRSQLGRLIQSAGKRLGVVIVPDWRAVTLDEERHLTKLFSYLDVDCVFDVGANTGQYGRMLRDNIGYRGRIISFEPNPVPLDELRSAALGDKLWHVEPFAFGSKPSLSEFHAYDRSDLGSFRSFQKSPHAPQNMGYKIVKVEVKILIDYIADAQQKWNFKRPFLKMDTQGFDLEVAKGAGPQLSKFVGIQSEVSLQPIYSEAPNYSEVLQYYQEYGFTVSRLCNIHEIHFPELVEIDLIMIRKDLIKS